jgi:DNA-directed RNA polymerase specialized sigma24 family protein
VFGKRRAVRIEALLPGVYGAALAASADPAGAADVAGRVLGAAAAEGARADGRVLMERVLLSAVRLAPHPAFAAMAVDEREVLVLARLARYTVPEISAALGIAESDVRSRMLSGLRGLRVTAVS